MKQLTAMPEDGQFVAVYEYNDQVWSGIYLWDDDGLITEYSDFEDGFYPVGGMGDTGSLPWIYNQGIEPKFFVV